MAKKPNPTAYPKVNKAREHRIDMEIIVDCYDEDEKAMGWFYHLESTRKFPFVARCVIKRAVSPLKVGERVEVIGMPPEDECFHEMFVTIRWQGEPLAVPLAQLQPVRTTDNRTRQAVEDWHYWVQHGYRF